MDKQAATRIQPSAARTTRRSTLVNYGCHNRAPFNESLMVQDGYFPADADYRVQRMVKIPDPMTKDCQFSKTELGKIDPKCNNCNWRQS